MFETFFFFLIIIAVALIGLAFYKASNPLLALGGTLLIVTSLFISTGGVERPDRIIITDTDVNTVQVDFNQVPYMPLLSANPGIWTINMLCFYMGLLCLVFVFVNFLYKRWIKRLIDRGV